MHVRRHGHLSVTARERRPPTLLTNCGCVGGARGIFMFVPPARLISPRGTERRLGAWQDTPMGRHFTVRAGATRIVFGAGSAGGGPGRELDALGARKALIVCTPGRAGDAAAMSDRLGARSAGTFADAREHVPARP